MSYFSTKDFISKIRKTDLARANRFEVYLTAPIRNSREVSLLCEEAAIPGLQLTTAPTKIGNWTENRVHGMEFFGDTATFTFYCDSDWDVRTYFEAWMSLAVDPNSKEVAFYNDIIGEAQVIALDRADNIIGTWTLHEAFPRMLNMNTLSQSGGEGAVRVTVSMAYRYWTSYSMNDRRSPLGKFLNLSGGSIKNTVKNKITNIIDDTLDKIIR